MHNLIQFFPPCSFLKGKGKVAQQTASYGEIREGKETARDEEIWQKGTWSSALKILRFHSLTVLYNGQLPLWDASAGNLAFIVSDWIFAVFQIRDRSWVKNPRQPLPDPRLTSRKIIFFSFALNFLYQKAFWGIDYQPFLDSQKSILYLFAQQPPPPPPPTHPLSFT